MDFNLVKESAHDPMFKRRCSRLRYTWPIKAEEIDFELARKLTAGIPDDELVQIGPFLTTNSPESHIGPFACAVDFLCPDGTPIYAAHSGNVVEIVESNELWGNGIEFAQHLNYVTLAHEGGLEYSQYCHLKKGSVSSHISVGEWVDAGQQIGVVGKTGWTDRDHIHFIVYESSTNLFGFISMIPEWTG